MVGLGEAGVGSLGHGHIDHHLHLGGTTVKKGLNIRGVVKDLALGLIAVGAEIHPFTNGFGGDQVVAGGPRQQRPG